jgi:hypothetical protein
MPSTSSLRDGGGGGGGAALRREDTEPQWRGGDAPEHPQRAE